VAQSPENLSCRLDVWLWRARFFKTRALSAKICESGHIRLVRQGLDLGSSLGLSLRVDKASQSIKVSDRLIFALGTRLIDVTITNLGHRRGPASEAISLYQVNSS
jgi:ribosome-associated heat shock protein Hsp15